MSARPSLSRRALVTGLLTGLLVALFVSLGTWQVHRRAWKLDLIDRVETRVNAPAVAAPATADPARLAADEYRHVAASGHWLTQSATWVQASTALGSGYWLLMALRPDDGGADIVVNRGFVPSDTRGRPDAIVTPDGAVTVDGLLRLSEPKGAFLRQNEPAQDRWYSRDVAAIASARGLTARTYFIDAGAGGGGLSVRAQAGLPAGATNGPVSPVGGLTVLSFPNNHLVYALTWYGLALMSLGAGAVVLRHDRRAANRAGSARSGALREDAGPASAPRPHVPTA